jgi:ketosteroid isomerase-like protein
VSELNVDLARRTFEAFAAGDVEAMVALVDPEFEFFPVTANITTGGAPYRGHDGLRQYVADAARVWRELRIHPDEYRDLGDRVLTLGHTRARGGGMILDLPSGWVWHMRDGKIVSCRVYASHEEALAAVGLDK